MTKNLQRQYRTSAIEMDKKDVHHIRQVALGNISDEILNISNLVESSIVDLSGEFQKLAQFSKQQTESISLVRDLLASEEVDMGNSTNNIMHEILTETAQVSAHLQKNVNKMVYSIQFQDRTRQLMLAISASLNIIMKLSESGRPDADHENIKEKVTISDDNKNTLNQLINEGAHKELDQNYILRMFVGDFNVKEPSGHEGSTEYTDIEFF